MTVEFGVVIPTWGAYGDAERIRRLIGRAEELGFASAWVGDHLFLPDYAIELSPANWYEALSCCLVGIGMTERIRFGTDVLVDRRESRSRARRSRASRVSTPTGGVRSDTPRPRAPR